MRNISFQYLLLFVVFFAFNSLSAQSEIDGSGNTSFLIYSLLAIVVLIIFFFIFQVSDNLLAIEAKKMGADPNKFSLFPGFGSLFAPKLPDYAADKPVRLLKQGFDIKLEGDAANKLDESIKSNTFAIQPPNFIGMSPIPKLLVEIGAEVKAGDPIFYDKKRPEIVHVAPVSGEVVEVNRGAKRSISEVVILADKEMSYKSFPSFDLDGSTREALVEYMLGAGVWPMIRQRPFNVIPEPGAIPRDIFVSTFDSAPLAPDLNFVIKGKESAFQKGLDVLNKLTTGKVHLSLDTRSENEPSAVFTNAKGVEINWFHGKHPAGNVGVQIHHIDPVVPNTMVWTLGVQEVVTIGTLFLEQRFDAERIVALTGSGLKEAKYVKTYVGARIGAMLDQQLSGDQKLRFISGDVLSGAQKSEDQFLDFFDDQVTAIEEGDYYEMFGWLLPTVPKPSISRTFPNFLFPDVKFKGDTNTHGERRAFVVTGQYEQVLPMDIYPQHLMKAILVNDFEKMEGLGIHELVEEDIALCEFVCTSKQPLQSLLRQGLEVMREQG